MSIRLFHTSDWHLGATLGGVSRADEHARFLDWLTGELRAREVDALVVSGDVFDHANPSAEALSLYYRFLVGLRSTPVRQVVVVAGNHDSPARLEAPREVLEALDVRVVGTVSGDASADRLLCPIPGPSGVVEAVVLALPYVHEYRLGIRTAGLDRAAVVEQYRARFTELYASLADAAARRWPGAALIGTGHLTCMGADPGDYPVSIHAASAIGGLPDSIFDHRLRYVALGHVHRRLRVGAGPAWYSGTPVPLQLGEMAPPRSVLQVDVAPGDGQIEPAVVPVPLSRRLLEVRGDVASVSAEIAALEWSEPLPPLVHVRLELERRSADAVPDLRRRVEAAWPAGDRPVLVQVRQDVAGVDAPSPSTAPTSLRGLDPEAVFLALCARQGEVADEPLLNAFRTLVQEAV